MTKKAKPGPWYAAVLRATRHSLPATTRVSAMATRPCSTVIPRQKVMSRVRFHRLYLRERFAGSKCLPADLVRQLPGEEVVQHALAHLVHFELQCVEELVQTSLQDRHHLRVVELRTQHSQTLFGGAGEGARPIPGDGVQRCIRYSDAVAHRAR